VKEDLEKTFICYTCPGFVERVMEVEELVEVEEGVYTIKTPIRYGICDDCRRMLVSLYGEEEAKHVARSLRYIHLLTSLLHPLSLRSPEERRAIASALKTLAEAVEKWPTPEDIGRIVEEKLRKALKIPVVVKRRRIKKKGVKRW